MKGFTEEEKRIFSLAFDIDFPYSGEVPQKMKQFCRDYVHKLHQQVPVMDFVSWIHETLTRIHPWRDFNGHMARALVNGELARKGQLPFLIFNEKKYVAAVQNKKFHEYLFEAQTKIKKNAERFDSEKPMKKVLVKVK